MKLPPRMKDCVEFLALQNPDVPRSSLLLVVLVEVSRMLCFHRCSVSGGGFPMIYGMVFMGSGTGKDKPIEELHRAIAWSLEENWGMLQLARKQLEEGVKVYADEKFGEKRTAAKTDYLREQMPRVVQSEYDKSTLEGLESERVTFERIGLGAPHFSNSEIADALIGSDKDMYNIISQHKDVYNTGGSKAKLIKMDKGIVPAKGIPQTMLVHSSPTPFNDNEKARDSFFSLLRSGMARRSLICYPSIIHSEEKTYEEELEIEGVVQSLTVDISRYFEELLKGVARVKTMGMGIDKEFESKVISYGEDVKRMISDYRKKCRRESIEFKSSSLDDEEILKAEIKDKSFRALRLSACISAFEHPKDLNISAKDFEFAICFVEDYSKQFKKFCKIKEDMPIEEKLYGAILVNPGISKRELMRNSPHKYRSNVKLFETLIPLIEEVAEENGEILKVTPSGNKRVLYKVCEPPRHQTHQGGALECVCSIGKTNRRDETRFEEGRIPFRDISHVVCGHLAYSAASFKDSYRKASNWLSGDDIIILDVDNDDKELSLEDAKVLFADHICIIATTKSHRVDKGKKGVKDRYRVVFPTSALEGVSKERYKDIMLNLVEDFGVREFVDEPALIDVARFYFGCPGCDVWCSSGDQIINWEVYDVAREEGKASTSVIRTGAKNLLPEGQVFESSGKSVGWDAFDALKVGETSPVRCIEGSHKDRNASAFIGRSKGSGNLFFKCSGCSICLFKS